MEAVLRRHRGEAPDPVALERVLHAEAREVYGWSCAPHDRFAEHEHPYTKILYCVRGSIDFTLSDHRSLALTAGDRLTLPAATRHRARAGPDGCACIEGKL